MDRDVAAAALRHCALFADCDPATIEGVVRQLGWRRFRRGDTIFHQGDPGDALHILATGAVKIALPSTEGEEAIIATLRPGDFFGELALLDGAPRSATAIALEPSETLVLPRAVFRDLHDRDAGLRDAFLTGVAAGTTVIAQGGVADRYYAIAAGTVEVTQVPPDGGAARVLRRMGTDEGFGEIGILAGSPRTATVTAVTDCTLVALDARDFLALVGVTEPGAPALAGLPFPGYR